MAGILFWYLARNWGEFRLLFTATVVPGAAVAICLALFANTSARLLRPPDVGAEGQEVVDLEQEAAHVVGLVIQRDQFPDKLFAPAKRDTLLEDHVNPVYDKEIRSEIFSQGTLMLRVVIQVSMLLAIPLMAWCLYIQPQYAPWYVAYVVVFNMLVGPVFSAGSVTSERERQTLDLLLTTAITPWQILSGKLRAGLRVSSVLTLFLLWPLLLACVMVSSYWENLLSVGAYTLIVVLTCLNTALLALFCSVVFRKTSISLMTTYLLIVVLFCAPLAAIFFARTVYADQHIARSVETVSITSPFVAAFAVPLEMDLASDEDEDLAREIHSWAPFAGYALFTGLLNALLLVMMIWLFRTRWRVAAA
jgi:ABC-type transport system involved in multi-copper enzyme maturation permease subunit